ncbi:SusC/RagA family TonB-linked outer membrane protein [Pseudobacter ginsenosidimutans]|uniref:SusC/RagA family TonB-linked outer membrane protein n=1 Tax=Pseudobacter ginsenosidimutans TaxID=661488 RepID=UPI001CEF85B1|nr:SusC/RagA family TonB-linked outer membrane protein [Pseudobacter ginsenosidimutans]
MALLLLLCMISFASHLNAQTPATITVSGTVVNDQNGELLPAVSIIVQKKDVGMSDSKGSFSVKIAPGASVTFSSVGYESVTETFSKDHENLVIRLKAATGQLGEVVVTALGIKREERALGYAVTKINTEQLTNAASTNWMDALSGKVAGLNMVRSNSGPGGSIKVILRGENNLTGDNEALIVVDGVVVSSGSARRTATGGSASGPTDGIQPTDFGSGLNDINPEDIESVTVLKGPAASALYGQRGANGALIITTRSGSKKKKLGITVSSNGSLETPNRWPDLQYEYGQGLNGAATYSYGSTADGPSTSNTSLSWGPRFNGQQFYQYDPNTQTTATERTPWVPYKNQIRDFFETGKSLSNSVSVDGNLFKTTSFRFSATHSDNTWILPNTGFNRTNLTLSTTTKVTSKFNVSLKANYTNKHSNNLPGVGYGNQSVMYWYVFWVPNADMNWLRNYWTTGKENQELKDLFTTSPENPYAVAYEFINGANRNNLTGNIQLNYNFTKELSLQLRGTIDRSGEDRWQHRPWTAARFANGSYRTQDIGVQELSGDFLLKYDKQLNKDFRITSSVGGSMLRNKYNRIETRADGMKEPGIYNFGNSMYDLVYLPDTSRFRINSFYGLFSLSYKNYLYMDLTGRQDWSSVLATPYRTDNVGFFYPSASVSFIASEYFKMPEVINYAKLRLSVASVGSGGTLPYLTSYAYLYPTDKVYTDSAVQNPATIPNPNLKPLKTTTYELGAEMKFFKNRLGFDVAVYKGQTKDQILQRIVDRSSGFTRQVVNAGQVDNSGLEVSLNGTPVETKDFKWSMFATFSTNKNKVVSLANDDSLFLLRSGAVGGVQIVAKVGGSMGDMYGIGFERSPDGQVIYDAATGLPKITSSPVYLGNTIPKYKFSFGNEFRYKSFRFNVLFDGQAGGVAHSYTHGRLADFGKLTATLPGRYSGIIGNGVIQDGDHYRKNDVIAKDITTFYQNSMGTANGEGATYKTDFIKLREARLDYTLPKNTLKALGLTRVTVGVYGRNLFIWSKWPMFDPEFGTLSGTDIVQGFEVGQFPSTRTVGFNLVVGIN